MHRLSDTIAIRNTAFNKMYVVDNPEKIGQAARGKVVKHPHVMPARDQRMHQMTANKTGPAGNENP